MFKSSCSVILPLVVALPTALAISTSAQALNFQLGFGPNASSDFQAAANEAAEAWSSVLTDNVTVNLNLEYTDLSEAGGVLGGAQPGKIKIKYEDYVSALFKDAISSEDFLSVNSLPLSAKGREQIQLFQAGSINLDKVKLESKEFAFLMDGQFAKGGNRYSPQPDFVDSNGNDNNKNVLLTRAQAKALDLLDANSKGLDGLIKINSNAVWDTDRSDGISEGHYDIASVLQHEIGHALGAVSGVDALDFLASSTGPTDIEKNDFSYLTPLDFYRYSAESAALGVSDVTLGGSEKYFSLDGGESAVISESGQAAYFSTGSYAVGGDGYQGSHWKLSNAPLGIMNPNLQAGQSIDISALDRTLFDVVGWDTTDTNAERAAAVGFNWEVFNNGLINDRQALNRSLVEQWQDDIPNVEAALGDAATDDDIKFRQKVQEKFDKLIEKLAKERDSKKRSEELDKFYKDIDKATEERNKSIRELPKEIIKVDDKVREWLYLPVDKLADEFRESEGSTINRFSNVLKSIPEEDRNGIESRLEAAASQLVDDPNKLVDDLLKTSGPANPIGRSSIRWWWWWQEEGDDTSSNWSEKNRDNNGNGFGQDKDRYENLYYSQVAAEVETSVTEALNNNNNTLNNLTALDASRLQLTGFENAHSTEARDIPEPSSILAIFSVAAIGAGLRRKKR
ncbi:MAG: NF038122 family metalloprotease [Cyanobacteria bacterium P01_C01_bin.69]